MGRYCRLHRLGKSAGARDLTLDLRLGESQRVSAIIFIAEIRRPAGAAAEYAFKRHIGVDRDIQLAVNIRLRQSLIKILRGDEAHRMQCRDAECPQVIDRSLPAAWIQG